MDDNFKFQVVDDGSRRSRRSQQLPNIFDHKFDTDYKYQDDVYNLLPPLPPPPPDFDFEKEFASYDSFLQLPLPQSSKQLKPYKKKTYSKRAISNFTSNKRLLIQFLNRHPTISYTLMINLLYYLIFNDENKITRSDLDNFVSDELKKEHSPYNIDTRSFLKKFSDIRFVTSLENKMESILKQTQIIPPEQKLQLQHIASYPKQHKTKSLDIISCIKKILKCFENINYKIRYDLEIETKILDYLIDRSDQIIRSSISSLCTYIYKYKSDTSYFSDWKKFLKKLKTCKTKLDLLKLKFKEDLLQLKI